MAGGDSLASGEAPQAIPLPPVLPLRVVFRAAQSQRLPPFLGTALHGAFGHALYGAVCTFAEREQCAGCPVEKGCAYRGLFAVPAPDGDGLAGLGIRDAAPRPMVLAPEPGWTRLDGSPVRLAAGDELPVRVTLIGSAARDLGMLLVALREVARRGLGLTADGEEPRGGGRATLELLRVTSEDGERLVYDADSGELTPVGPVAIGAGAAPEKVEIEFVTPLRLKARGRVVSRVRPEDFCAALARRAAVLEAMYGAAASRWDNPDLRRAARSMEVLRCHMRPLQVRRYSSRQGRRMSWPGLMGSMVWRGPGLSRLWPLLRFGELVQVGKGTTFGFGRYRLVPAQTPAR